MEDAVRQKYVSLMTNGYGDEVSVDLDKKEDFKLNPDYLSKHRSFRCSKSGLKLHSEFNFLAASPDGLTSCECCGSGILEIKTLSKYFYSGIPCPHPNDVCLDDTFALKTSHHYYTQVQFQLLVTQAKFCDFVCSTKNELSIQRLFPDIDFITNLRDRCVSFFKSFIVKELLIQELHPHRPKQ